VAEGVVFDLGWRPHEGPRLGRAGARIAVYKDGLRRVLGLRRRARRKVFPFVMLSAALVPGLFVVGIGVVLRDFGEIANFFGHAEYFNFTRVLALIFIALAAGELLVPDRVNGTLSVYASRPLTTTDYVAMRAASLATVVAAFLWIPHLALFLGRAWVGGFGSYVAANVEILWETLIASLVYFAAFAPLAFLIAAFSKRAAVAAGLFIGVITIGGQTVAGLVRSGFDVLGLFDLSHNAGYVKDWVLGASSQRWSPELAGYEPWMSLLVIIGVAALCFLGVHARHRSER